MNQLNAYLFFDGTCADAMRFYEGALGGKLDLITHAQSPTAGSTPAGNAGRIMHARLTTDAGTLMASDTLAGQHHEGMHGFSLTLVYPTAADARRIFDALGQGGRVTMPIQKTFWAEAFGTLIDRFGTPWMVNGAMMTS